MWWYPATDIVPQGPGRRMGERKAQDQDQEPITSERRPRLAIRIGKRQAGSGSQ